MVFHQAIVTLHVGSKIDGHPFSFDRVERAIDDIHREVRKILTLLPHAPQLAWRSNRPIARIMTVGREEQLRRIEQRGYTFSRFLITNLLAYPLIGRHMRGLYLDHAERNTVYK